jgi:hypothetical protein
MPASNDLLQTFEDAIADFNDAANVGTYSKFRLYLYPHERLLIQKVDDPGQFESGNRAKIMKYLNTSQAITGFFPQFHYGKPHPKVHTHPGKRAILEVGDVTGKGKYQDKFADKRKISVQYCLRFKKNPEGIWLLSTALVAPI